VENLLLSVTACFLFSIVLFCPIFCPGDRVEVLWGDYNRLKFVSYRGKADPSVVFHALELERISALSLVLLVTWKFTGICFSLIWNRQVL
jgi:hypothetical protein